MALVSSRAMIRLTEGIRNVLVRTYMVLSNVLGIDSREHSEARGIGEHHHGQEADRKQDEGGNRWCGGARGRVWYRGTRARALFFRSFGLLVDSPADNRADAWHPRDPGYRTPRHRGHTDADHFSAHRHPGDRSPPWQPRRGTTDSRPRRGSRSRGHSHRLGPGPPVRGHGADRDHHRRRPPRRRRRRRIYAPRRRPPPCGGTGGGGSAGWRTWERRLARRKVEGGRLRREDIRRTWRLPLAWRRRGR